MTAEITTIVGQLSISEGKWRSQAPNQVAVREPKSADAPGAGKGDLFIVAEIQSRVKDIDRLEQQLAQTIRDNYYLSRGSVTASLRRAVQAGNELLYHYNQKVKAEARLVGGAVALVMCQEDAFVAQIGPAAFFAILGDHIQRYPVRSPWLDEALSPAQDEEATALGLRQLIEPQLHHMRVNPKDMLVLADSRLAGQLPLRELVQAVAVDNIKTAVKNLGKIARAGNCSALALEVVETGSTGFGPLKISTPPKISSLFRRHRGQPAPAASAAPELEVESVTGEAAGAAATASAVKKPFHWLGSLTGKTGPDIPAEDDTVTAPPEPAEKFTYYQSHYDDDEDEEAEPAYAGREMASMAPGSTFGQSRRNQSGAGLPGIGSALRWVGMGLIMLLALLAGGLKNILGMVLPGDSHSPRLAGTQAQRQPPSGATWKLLRNIAIAIPILVVLIVAVSYLQKGRIREAEYQEFLTTAKNKFEQSQAVNDPSAALGLMAEAESALVQAEQIKQAQPEISDLRQQMAAEADRIGNVQPLYYLPQLRQYTDVGTSLKSIIVQGVEVYVLDTGNDRIYHHRLDDTGEALLPDDESVLMVARGQAVENISVADLIGMTWMPTGGNRQTSDLIILNSSGLLEYNPNWGITTSALAGGESLALPVAVDSFFGNFYVLDPQANQLLRYLPTADGYSAPPENYFSADQNVDLTNAVDMTIDGAIYILFRDGRISKYLSGQPAEFNLTGLDIPLSNPVAIFTAPDEEAQHLYVADAGHRRIVQLNKDGSFVRQFKPRVGEAIQFDNLQDIYVDEIGGRIYILDNNNFYLTNIPTE